MSHTWKICWDENFLTFFVWEEAESCWSMKKENWIYHSNTNIAYDSVRNYIFAKATVNIKSVTHGGDTRVVKKSE